MAEPVQGGSSGGGTSAAERLMHQHQSGLAPPAAPHLSYAEREAALRLEQEQQDRFISQASSSKLNASTTSNANHANSPSVDLESEAAFPSLGAPTVAAKPATGWGVGTGPALSARLSMAQASKKAAPATKGVPNTVTGPAYTESLIIEAKNVSIGPVPPQYRERGPRAAGEKREPDPQTLPEVIRALQRRHPTVTIESSTSREKVSLLFRTPTSLPLKSAGASLTPEERVAGARNELVARVSRKVSLSVPVPGSVRPFIIGARGKTLKQIVTSTGADVQVPRRDAAADDLATAADGESSTAADDEEVIITVSGEEAAAIAARDQILAIVDERTSRTTERVTTIPHEDYRFVNGVGGRRLAALIAVATGGADDPDVSVYVPPIRARSLFYHDLASGEAQTSDTAQKPRETAIVVSGHRDLVAKVVEAIESAHADTRRALRSFDIDIPKRQHRLVAQAADEIFEATGSLVEVPLPSDPKEKITIRGEQMANIQALQLATEKANTMSIDTLDLTTVHRRVSPDASAAYARDVARYLVARGKLRAVQDAHADIKIFVPRPPTVVKDIEIVGKRPDDVAAARQSVIGLVRDLAPEIFGHVELDPLVHSHLIGRKGARVRAFKDARGVDVVFPPEGQQASDVLLVSIGAKDEFATQAALQGVAAELQKLAQEVANIKSTTLTVPAKLHGAILGPNGTTLNAIIGEAKLVHVTVGHGHGGGRTGAPAINGDSADVNDQILIRGPAEEVARVAADIQRLAEEAEREDVVNSHETEFEIDSKHVGHIVGKAGAGIIKLREELGVRVDFTDSAVAAADGAKKRRTRTTVTIKGRKENVNEAKKRILNQVERLADETVLNVPILPGIDRGGLMGKGGKYVLRLQDTHGVFINIPRAGGGGDDDAREDMIVIRGPKKGAEAARKELVEVMEYEKEHNTTAVLEVPTRTVPRILGKAGSTIDKIKEDSGVQEIDVRRNGNMATVTLRGGTKAAISTARKAVQAIVETAGNEVTVELHIRRAHHQALIGKGGAKVREIVRRAGGDPEARTVRFPAQGDQADGQDVVTLHGPEELVQRVKEELQQEVAELEDRVCVGVAVPRDRHAALIGRGAAGIKELQSTHKVSIAVPGWREWTTAGDPINATALVGVDDADIIKIIGSASACKAASQSIQARKPREGAHKTTIPVSARCHFIVSKSGVLQRLPRGVRVEHGSGRGASGIKSLPPKRQSAEPTSARIDDPESDSGAPLSWEVHSLEDGSDDAPAIAWNISAGSGADLEAARELIAQAVEVAQQARLLAYATVPSTSMARVVGRGGSGLNTLKATGAYVEVLGRKDADTISVIGQADQLEQVRGMLEGMLR